MGQEHPQPTSPLTVPLPRSGTVRADLLSGFLVFLIALPLCLAIAQASKFPPIAGIWTAVAGGLIATWISNSQLTIKGPAAGLIVIVAGAVTELGAAFGSDLPEQERLLLGYHLTLGIGVASGIIQIFFGLLRLGKLGDFFPLAAVHGMLASIGIIIIAKQAYQVFGAEPIKGAGPIELLTSLPYRLGTLNPAIALIGLVSLFILFGLPLIKNTLIRRIPAPMIVLLVAVPLGIFLNLDHEHTFIFPRGFSDAFGVDGEEGQHFEKYSVGPKFLVEMPHVLEDASSAFAFPDFRGLISGVGLKYLLLFAIIGSLESMLSAKAIDLVDKQKRKTSLDRDLMAIGVANTFAAFVGGLPMISEIVRSSANQNNGAQTRLANFFHGVFLLMFVIFLPGLIHSIPLAALAAMLVYTGTRLAHPKEFIKTWKIGKEQLVVFCVTILVTLSTDLLMGIASGVATEFFLHILHGMPIKRAIRPNIQVEEQADQAIRITLEDAAVFTNWIPLKSRLLKAGASSTITVDFSRVKYVDHTVMESLHELEKTFSECGGNLYLIGLEQHRSLSKHPLAARKKRRESGIQKAESVEPTTTY